MASNLLFERVECEIDEVQSFIKTSGGLDVALVAVGPKEIGAVRKVLAEDLDRGRLIFYRVDHGSPLVGCGCVQ